MHKFTAEIEKFRKLFSEGVAAIKEAATIYVKAIDSDAEARNVFKMALPQISAHLWNDLEKLGRGELHEDLILCCSRSAIHIKKMSIAEQTKIVENGVPLVQPDGSIKSVKYDSLDKSQTAQVFDGNKIRSVTDQLSWIRSQGDDKNGSFRKYRIEDKRLVITGPTSLSVSELKRIIVQLEGLK